MHFCFVALLTDKEEETYKLTLDKLVSKSSRKLKPEIVFVDFEKAAINAFDVVFCCIIKGCNFHFTNAVWRNVQFNGLVKIYKSDATIRCWINQFKALPFVPLEEITKACELIKDNKPVDNENVDAFYMYFMSTWVDGKGAFDTKIWNHHNTIGPRTNNHVEGANHKLNEFIDAKKHPDIYSLILTLKDMETEAKIQFMRVKDSNEPQKRKQIYIRKDQAKEEFKSDYFNNKISLDCYMNEISKLFTYGVIENQIIHNMTMQQKNKTDEPLSEIEKKKIALKNMMKDFIVYLQAPHMDHQLIKQNFVKQKSMLDYLIKRRYQQINVLPLYDSKMPLVSSLINMIDNSFDYAPVSTTGDGNCFYNAISLVLFGHEGHSTRLRLATAYIFTLYEDWFTLVLSRTASTITYEQLLDQTVKDKVWANEYNILAMSIVLNKPI